MPLPVYDPKSFADIDLRKYHIHNIKDAIRFIEFTSARLEEALFVLKKFNTKLVTFETVTRQLQQKQEEQQQSYGNPAHPDNKPQEEEIIQKVEDSVEKEHEALLDDIRQATADERRAEGGEDVELDHTAAHMVSGNDMKPTAVFEKYKVVEGAKYDMYYRDDGKGFKMVSEKDVPEDIKSTLLENLDKVREQRTDGEG